MRTLPDDPLGPLATAVAVGDLTTMARIPTKRLEPPARRRLRRWLRRLPGVRQVHHRIVDRGFERWPGAYRGVFKTFAEAAATAPLTLPLGYDNPASASMYRERLSRVYSSDYPVLYWLNRILGDLQAPPLIFDFGGHVGISYYAYAPYVQYPPTLTWKVFELPAVIEAGRALAGERAASQLRFTPSFEDAAGSDIFLANGVAQYVDEPLASKLAALKAQPTHLVINRIPLCDGDSFVTLQNIGTAFCPYRVFNRQEFVESLRHLEYEMVDEWYTHENSVHIPFHPDCELTTYGGLHLAHAPVPVLSTG
jgi:putative methyltransferase (TIGR04325 family)